jgi:uncharacterized protein YdeI (YjbR/CyaY-like superfamily)
MSAEIDQFFESVKYGKDSLILLRKLLNQTKLFEEYKWKQPCYTYNGKNVIILAGLKDHVVISFFKGVLLNDKSNLLEKPGDHTQSARIIRFYTLDEVRRLTPQIKAFIKEAIEIEESGKKLEKKESVKIEMPNELINHFKTDKQFEKAYQQLNPGRQRAYLMFFSAAKQAETRTTRIEKYKDRILKGYGFNDCICGLSKRMPNCDGSHKHIPGFKNH